MFRKVKMILSISTIIIATLVIVSWAATDRLLQFGGTPAGDRLVRMNASGNYKDCKFVNSVSTGLEMKSGTWDMFASWIFGKEIRVPDMEIPVNKLNGESFKKEPSDRLSITRMGHSSVLIEVDGKRILTDPIWSKRCSPTSLVGPSRFHAPPISLEDLPPLDAVLISHDHFDHLDKKTVCMLAKTETHFFIPLGVGAHLEKWKIPSNRFTELNWWDSVMLDNIKLAATPARHFSGRGIGDRNATLWTSWSIISPKHRIFFSGDSGFFPGFAKIGEKYGPFDITLMECGAYNQNWADIHMLPEQTVEAHIALKGRLLIPIHWGTFNLSFHNWFDPPERLIAAAKKKNIRVAVPKFGETVFPELSLSSEKWWQHSLVF